MQMYLGVIAGNEVAASKDKCICYFDGSCQLPSTVVEQIYIPSSMGIEIYVFPKLLLLGWVVKKNFFFFFAAFLR